jgi:hypothetical protein
MNVSLPTLHLVSCVGQKHAQPAPARDLYCSTWFRFARAAVEREPWAILSARHGLLWPDVMVAPYEETLRAKSVESRFLWATRVLVAVPSANRYVIWAGEPYAEFLAPDLGAELPLRGLGIGQQLKFLKAKVAACAA